jgi:alkyl hydroperoxide reductase subunit D
MTIEAATKTETPSALVALAEALPDFAKDISKNLIGLSGETLLTDQQKWGAFVASAYAVGNPAAIKAMDTSARQAGLSEEALTAAKKAAAIMAMNNIYYRALHLMQNGEYRTLPARLKMNVLADPGVPKVDFELWSLAVSAVNGCEACLDAHEGELKRRSVSAQVIQAALRIAAVVNAAAMISAAEGAA